MAIIFRTYRIENEVRIDGVFFLAFIHNQDYFLTPISIYKDGMIDCWELVDFEEFKRKVRSGWVVTQPPEGAKIGVAFLASFNAVTASYWIKPEELIKEVEDEIERLNGRPTSREKCKEAYKAFQDNPTEELREKLRQAYEIVPEHIRPYLGDMDVNDIPIRMVIYGEEEIEKWSHWQAAKSQGLHPLPSIKVKGVKPREKKPPEEGSP